MKRQISSLTGLRFFIVVLLFLHHWDMFADLQIPGYSQWMKYLSEGYVSVDFFFVLSGFVITYSYMSRLQNKEVTPSTFLFNRVSKLYPVHLLLWVLCIVAYGGFTHILQSISSKQFWIGALLLQSYVPINNFAFWGNGLSWSVSTELFFYIAFVFLIKFSTKERTWIFSLLLGVILFNSIAIGNESPVASWLYYINPIFRLLDFMAGMLLCEFMQKMSYHPASVKTATLLEISSLLVLLCFMVISSNSPIRYNPRFQSYYYLIPSLYLIFAFSFNKGYISSVCSKKIFQVLGNCSFTFYMVHQLVLFLIKKYFASYIISMSRLGVFGLLGLVVSIIASLLLHYCYEKPINQLMRKKWKSRKQGERLQNG